MATINDVAKVANVSIATVSRVIHGNSYVRAEIRERVLDSIDKLGYRPNHVARTLRSQKSSIIGVVITDIMNPFYTNLARAVEDVSYSKKYGVFLCNSDENPQKERFYLSTMEAENVAGIIISPTNENYSSVSSLIKLGIPIVAVDRKILETPIDTVVINNVGGAYRATLHLIQEHKHTRIGIITGPQESTTGRERLEGFINAHKKSGLNVSKQYVFSHSFKEEYGYTSMKQLLKMPEPPTAIFAANNLLGRGAIRAIEEAKLTVPGQIAIVMFDQVDWADFYNPPLSYIKQPSYDLGRISAELLFQRIEDEKNPIHVVTLEPEFIIAGSCGCSF